MQSISQLTFPSIAVAHLSLRLIMSLHLFFAILHIASAAGYCYSRNGTTLLNPAFQPCNNATTHSACCMTNHSGAGDVGIADDVCLENGLCQNYAVYNGENEGQPVWARQGCTDPLWNSPYCLGDVCNKPEYADQWGNVGVWNCGGKKWCCGEKTCCDGNNIFELAATVGPTSTILSATSFASASTLSTSKPTTSPSSEGSGPSRVLSTGAKAGIGAGVAAFVIVAAAVALLLFRSRKSNGRKDSPSDGSTLHTDVLQEQKHQGHVYGYELYSEHGFGELSERERAELAADNAPQELEARSGNVH
ncbi:hypothetical protein P153DRAFT_399853 [Dothidotthia symphoricarpi CBS 119687]|uniref:Mid2 domain-containing protein n=1 Tax=Dothidotthia symphoricarpi CBS 119687 TaxID=1392245 RepID=A0A6A6A1J0_9PLEO|nr:uncharacterized protein P153DRAFT_399853 [Dothidotthia symphoricarpi CBS 119687]KAF2125709.1 hypothetical protein P153DRAFT_399853 [Dothidotthia symphoricarpi CBS 119687]